MAILSQTDLLRRVPVFSCLNEAALAAVSAAAIKRRASRGDVLLRQDVSSQQLVIFLTGKGRVRRSDSFGREVTLATLQPGDHAGEMSLLDAGPHSATVQADCRSDILVVRRFDIHHLLPATDTFAHALMLGLVHRLRSTNRDIQSLALLDVRGRVLERLRAMAVVKGEAQIIEEKICRQDLAKLVGASREMVSRVMTALETDGILSVSDAGHTHLHNKVAVTQAG